VLELNIKLNQSFSKNIDAGCALVSTKIWNAIEDVSDSLSGNLGPIKPMFEAFCPVCDLSSIADDLGTETDSFTTSSLDSTDHEPDVQPKVVIENMALLEMKGNMISLADALTGETDSLSYSLGSLSYSVDIEHKGIAVGTECYATSNFDNINQDTATTETEVFQTLERLEKNTSFFSLSDTNTVSTDTLSYSVDSSGYSADIEDSDSESGIELILPSHLHISDYHSEGSKESVIENIALLEEHRSMISLADALSESNDDLSYALHSLTYSVDSEDSETESGIELSLSSSVISFDHDAEISQEHPMDHMGLFNKDGQMALLDSQTQSTDSLSDSDSLSSLVFSIMS